MAEPERPAFPFYSFPGKDWLDLFHDQRTPEQRKADHAERLRLAFGDFADDKF